MTDHTALPDQLIKAMSGMTVETYPWQWGYHPALLDEPQIQALVESFPGELLETAAAGTRSEKTYRLRAAVLAGGTALPPAWMALYSCLTSLAYRRRIEALTGLSLAGSVLEIGVWEYGPNDWLAPHVDKADKIVSQVIYLPAEWREGWGGRMLILPGPDAAPVARLVPHPGASSVVVRSPASWHAVEQVGGQVPVPRRSVTAMFRTAPDAAPDPVAERYRMLQEALDRPADTAW